ncbi:MAG: outer membrane beta-barrel protein, partial [candidate division Zixibacteria bacterium]|nr:outer membrane beta-barrel protein [candidate division Zixibacteria bacterium]
ALIILIAFGVSASAQIPTPFSLYAGGAVSLPQSPTEFKDSFKSGFHGMVGFGWKLMPNFQAVGKIELHSFGFDFTQGGLATAYPALTGGSTRIWMFGADGRYSLGLPAAPFKPFGLAGIGLAKVDQTDFSGDPLATSFNALIPSSQSKVYWNIGAGFEFKGTPLFGLFAQVRYVSIATEGSASTFVPITVGFKFF